MIPRIPVRAARSSWLALIALQVAWFGLLDPLDPLGPAAGALLFALPLVAGLVGIWRLRPRALVIGGMLLIVYFCIAVAELWADPAARLPALVQLLLVALYFAALPRRRGPDGTGPRDAPGRG